MTRLVLWLALGLLATQPIRAQQNPPIVAVAFTPNGKAMVAGSQSGLAIHSWPDLEQLRRLECSVANIHDLAFSPDGSQLAVAGGAPAEEGRLALLDWPTGKERTSAQLHDDTIMSVDWRNDRELATASLDHSIALADSSALKLSQRLRGHSKGVVAVGFVANGEILVSAGLDQNLRVWKMSDGALIRSLNNHTRPVHQLALRPASTGLPMVASVSSDRTVRLWQPTIGRMVRFAKLTTTPLAVAWLPGGERVAVATSDGQVALIDPNTVQVVQLKSVLEGRVFALAAHPTDGDLVAGGRDGRLVRVILSKEKTGQ